MNKTCQLGYEMMSISLQLHLPQLIGERIVKLPSHIGLKIKQAFAATLTVRGALDWQNE